jgi:hypothetical protein
MAKSPKKHRAEWTKADVKELKQLAKTTPAAAIARKTGRTVGAVRIMAHREGISLRRAS